MTANELRIGNWVKEESLGYKQWELKDYDNYHGEHYPENWISDKIEPIPLTPEILEKAEFTSNLKDVYIKDLIDEKRFSLLKNRNGFVGLSHSITYVIKYVHQLQNLYFSLTGEELEINL